MARLPSHLKNTDWGRVFTFLFVFIALGVAIQGKIETHSFETRLQPIERIVIQHGGRVPEAGSGRVRVNRDDLDAARLSGKLDASALDAGLAAANPNVVAGGGVGDSSTGVPNGSRRGAQREAQQRQGGRTPTPSTPAPQRPSTPAPSRPQQGPRQPTQPGGSLLDPVTQPVCGLTGLVC